MRRAFAVLLLVVAAVVTTSNASAADRGFSVRFQTDTDGNITIAANTLMTCPAAAAGCAAGQAGAAADDNDFTMGYVDVDSDLSTFDSSTADLVLPGSASVLFAGLYWVGDTSAGAGGVAAPNAAGNGAVLFSTPAGGGYQSVTASTVDTSSVTATRYQGFADVTSAVQAAGAGTYGVANVQAGTGADRYAGWSLVVAYADPLQPPRDLTVLDGFITQGGGAPPTTVPVSGFRTPNSGPVNTTLGFITSEGDAGITGDTAKLGSTTLSDAAHPANNFFDSAISNLGAAVTTKSPNYVNQLGFDADLLNANGVLTNGQTSTTLTLATSGDTYYPGVLTFATELFAPNVVVTKTATDVNGAPLEPGDIIRYDLSATNTGEDSATDLTLTDPIPADTSYVAGSLDIVSSPGGIAGPKTDAPGDDQAEGSQSGGVTFRVGSGADASSGGTLAAAGSVDVQFEVRVNAGTVAGTVIQNQSSSSYGALSDPTFQTTNLSFPPTTLTVATPDLTLTKTSSGSFRRGGGGAFQLVVTNSGNAPTQGTVTVTDNVPASMPVTATTGSGWTCGHAGQLVTCTRADALAAAASFPPIVIDVHVSLSAPASVTNTAHVAGGNDIDPSNNSASDTVHPGSPPSRLVLTKTTPDNTATAGGRVRFKIVLKARGSTAAVGVRVCDTLPSHMTFVSAAGAVFSNGAACWTLTTGLAVGSSMSWLIVARIDASAPTGNQTNTARATATNAAAVSASATVAVQSAARGPVPVTG